MCFRERRGELKIISFNGWDGDGARREKFGNSWGRGKELSCCEGLMDEKKGMGGGGKPPKECSLIY